MNLLNSFQFELLSENQAHIHKIKTKDSSSDNTIAPERFVESGLVLKSSFHSNNQDSKHSDQCLYLKNEFITLKTLRHKNIVTAFEFYDGIQILNEKKQCGYVLEQGQMDLNGFLFRKDVKLSLIRRVFREIATGLQYVHDQGFAHNDIKCGNVFVFLDKINNKFDIKLADFEMARKVNFYQNGDQQKQMWSRRSLEYAAPEIVTQQRSRNNLQIFDEQKGDIFALGVILFKIVFQTLPFSRTLNGVTQNDGLYKLIVKKKYKQFWDRQFVSQSIKDYQNRESDTNFDDFKDLIQQMLAFDPQERIDITSVLYHPFFL